MSKLILTMFHYPGTSSELRVPTGGDGRLGIGEGGEMKEGGG